MLAAAITLALAAGWQLGGAAYIQAKALLAQHLLAAAWNEAKAGRERPRPWPWADTWPVARLRVPRLGIDQIVLAGAQPATLAFGPGLLGAATPPAAHATRVFAGHRDTHFRFLQHMQAGDTIVVTDPGGTERDYAVTHKRVISRPRLSLAAGARSSRLIFTTCYPFDAPTAGGPRRLIVYARSKRGVSAAVQSHPAARAVGSTWSSSSDTAPMTSSGPDSRTSWP